MTEARHVVVLLCIFPIPITLFLAAPLALDRMMKVADTESIQSHKPWNHLFGPNGCFPLIGQRFYLLASSTMPILWMNTSATAGGMCTGFGCRRLLKRVYYYYCCCNHFTDWLVDRPAPSPPLHVLNPTTITIPHIRCQAENYRSKNASSIYVCVMRSMIHTRHWYDMLYLVQVRVDCCWISYHIGKLKTSIYRYRNMSNGISNFWQVISNAFCFHQLAYQCF